MPLYCLWVSVLIGIIPIRIKKTLFYQQFHGYNETASFYKIIVFNENDMVKGISILYFNKIGWQLFFPQKKYMAEFLKDSQYLQEQPGQDRHNISEGEMGKHRIWK